MSLDVLIQNLTQGGGSFVLFFSRSELDARYQRRLFSAETILLLSGIDFWVYSVYTIPIYNILVRKWINVNGWFDDIGCSDAKVDERLWDEKRDGISEYQ
mgnify:FL=1